MARQRLPHHFPCYPLTVDGAMAGNGWVPLPASALCSPAGVDVRVLTDADAGKRAGGDVAHRVAARLARGQAVGGEQAQGLPGSLTHTMCMPAALAGGWLVDRV